LTVGPVASTLVPLIRAAVERSATGVESFANAIIVLWGWRRFAVAFGAGALSALAFAPFDAFPVLWLTFPVFVWLIDGATAAEGAGFLRRLLPAAGVGWSFGFGFFLAGLWWVGSAFLVDAAVFGWLMPLAVVVLPAGLALFWGFGAALARLFWCDRWSRILVFATALSIAEWLRGHLFTGFPWNAVGYALTPFPVMMQSAALVGIWGLTLAAFVIFAAPALLVAIDTTERRAGRIAFAAAGALFLAHLGYGIVRLAGGPDALVPGVHLRIMQPDVPHQGWGVEQADEIMQRYVQLSGEGKGAAGLDGVTHLIWPESAFPFLLTERPSALNAIADLVSHGTTLITGAARAEMLPDGERPQIFNSIYVIDHTGEIRDAYDKVHLVPFGEYVPFGGLLRRLGLRQLITLPGGFSAGTERRTLSVPGAPPAAPLICYEIVFPGAVLPSGARPGWLLNVTDDSWFGDTPGPHQHFLQARVRAVEEGLPLVRAADSGVSAIVDPHGRIIASLGLGRMGVFDGPLPAALPPTPYARFGDLIFAILLAVSGASGFFTNRRCGI
jgi:apolipoprotein N-acyltransferase